MRVQSINDVRSLIFALDGTLYEHRTLNAQIAQAVVALVAGARGLSEKQAGHLVRESRRSLAHVPDELPHLSYTCRELGIDLRDYVRALEESVHPERFLQPDPGLVALLQSLRDRFDLYIYTNNGFFLARRILALLGVEDCFRRLYSLEFAWRPKPDAETLQRLLGDVGGTPQSFMFIGDSYHVDLREPAGLGLAVCAVSGPADLRRLPGLLGLGLP